MVIESDDPISLALVQTFGDVSWVDILMDQHQIHQIFDSYEAPDGSERKISKGQRHNFTLAILYIQYRYVLAAPYPT